MINDTAIARIEHDLYLDRVRESLDIKVDPERTARLRERLAALCAEQDAEYASEKAVLARFAATHKPKPRPPSVLVPMGMDEHVATERGDRVLVDQETRAKRPL